MIKLRPENGWGKGGWTEDRECRGPRVGKSGDLSRDEKGVVMAGQRETLKGGLERCARCAGDPRLAATDGLHAENGAVHPAVGCTGNGWNWETRQEARVVLQARGDAGSEEAVFWRLRSRVNKMGRG